MGFKKSAIERQHREAVAGRKEPRPEPPPPCDYDTGTAYTGPGKCGRPPKFIWADETSGKDRPVCGIHARSARIKMHAEVRPLTAPGSEDGE